MKASNKSCYSHSSSSQKKDELLYACIVVPAWGIYSKCICMHSTGHMSDEASAKEILEIYLPYVWKNLLLRELNTPYKGSTYSSPLSFELDDLFECFDVALRESQLEGDKAWIMVELMPSDISRRRFSTIDGKLKSFGCIWVRSGIQEQCEIAFNRGDDGHTKVSTTFNRHGTYMQKATHYPEKWKPIGRFHHVATEVVTEGCVKMCAACGLRIMPLNK